MESFTSEDARRDWRRILDRVQRGEQIGITRYGDPLAIVVPADWAGSLTTAITSALEEAAISGWEDDRSNYAKVIEIYVDQVTSIVGRILHKAAGGDEDATGEKEAGQSPVNRAGRVTQDEHRHHVTGDQQ